MEGRDVPWFAHRPGDFFVFRVNRRPLDEDNLFAPEGMPEDVFEHFIRMLAPGYQVVTGRRNQRTWRVGGLQVDHENRTLVGKLGWVPRGEEVVPEWSEEAKDWISSTVRPRGGRVVPFGFEGDSRLLAVLSDRESSNTTIASVFEKILRENEREAFDRTTEWGVEPILDVEDFLSWLKTLDVVTSVSFTARLPNPEPRDAFRDLAQRMAARRATRYTETMKSEHEAGLVGVEDDPDFEQAIAMGEYGSAVVRGRGRSGGTVRHYDSQSTAAARERVEDLPADWEDMWHLLKAFLKGRLRRFLPDDER